MFVIDVFEASRLRELGVLEQAFEPEIFAVGFFVLDNQTEELLVGEIGRCADERSCHQSYGPCRRA